LIHQKEMQITKSICPKKSIDWFGSAA